MEFSAGLQNDNIYKTSRRNYLIVSLFILLASFVLYYRVGGFGFTSMDDDRGIIENPVIQNLNWENIVHLFTEKTIAHYHPVTDLTFAVEYSFSGLNPGLFHFTNLFLHLICILLVFRLSIVVLRNIWSAGLVTVLFAIHPLNVEAVSWISARSTLLSSMFYLLAVIQYLKYLDTKGRASYILLVLFALLALLSKTSSATLPLVLFAFDFLYKRKLSFRLIIEKIPLFALSGLFGLLAIKFAKDFGSLGSTEDMFSLVDRFFFFWYSLLHYLSKAILPFELSALYPKPIYNGAEIPLIYYLSPIIIVAILILTIIKKKHRRIRVFGILFFVFALSMVLHIISLGNVIAADRYVYLPYLGLFIPFAGWFELKFKSQKFQKYRPYLLVLLISFVLFLFNQSWYRVGVWKNGETLFTDVIQKYPDKDFGYYGRGLYRTSVKNYQGAIHDYKYALHYNPYHNMAFNNLGVVQVITGNYGEAVPSFTSSINLKPDYDSYNNRGYALLKTGHYQEAVSDFDSALVLKKDYVYAIHNMGLAYKEMDSLDRALACFNKAIQKDTNYGESYARKASIFYRKGKIETAIKNYKKALNKNYTKFFVYYDLGNIYRERRNFTQAIEYYNQSLERKPNNPLAYNNRGICYYEEKNYSEAKKDFSTAIKLNAKFADAYNNRAIVYFVTNQKSKSCSDWFRASKLGHDGAANMLKQYCLKN